MYLRDHWYIVARSDELGRELMQRYLLNEPYVMYRTEDGRPVALPDRCPHRRYALSAGSLIGDNVRCDYHGLAFDPDGVCVDIPGQEKIPPQMCATPVPLVEQHNHVWGWMGDPADADPAQIPDFHWMDTPGWTCTDDRRGFDCHYQLVVDNLLDLTHETYVHTNTIGQAELVHAPIEARRENGAVLIDRVVRDCTPPPLFSSVMEFRGNIDRYQFVRFEPPCYVWIDARAVETGTNDFDEGLQWIVMNALTPETDDTMHYFWGVSRHFAQDDADMTKNIHGATVRTFEEDAGVLKLQHDLIKSDAPDAMGNNIDADRGITLAHRLRDELMAAEAAKAH